MAFPTPYAPFSNSNTEPVYDPNTAQQRTNQYTGFNPNIMPTQPAPQVQTGTESSYPKPVPSAPGSTGGGMSKGLDNAYNKMNINIPKSSNKPWWESGYGIAYGETPGEDTPWLKSQLEQNRMGMQSAYDRMAQGSASQLGTGMSSLARSGGINSGARERMANLSAYNNMMGNQGIGMKGSQMAQGLRGQDYQNRVARGTFEDQMRAAAEVAGAMGSPSSTKDMGERAVDSVTHAVSQPGAYWDENRDDFAKGRWDQAMYQTNPITAPTAAIDRFTGNKISNAARSIYGG